MKTREFIIDLKDAKNEEDVFRTFNDVLHFASEEQFNKWRMQWDSFNDMLWGFIQGSLPNDPVPYESDVEKLDIRIINSKHLNDVRARLVKRAELSITEELQELFEDIKKGQIERAEPNDAPVFKNSTLEIIS